MTKRIILYSLLIYLISCTSNDNGMHQAKVDPPKAVKTSLDKVKSEASKVEAFSNFLNELSSHQMVHTYEVDLHQSVTEYIPASLRSDGFDLHLREIGHLDTFRLVFHEYFDLYDNWSKTYLNIFSPSGQHLEFIKLWELSFEGLTNIDLIDEKIIEISYRDFFDKNDLRAKALVPADNFYLNPISKNKKVLEGTIYQYYILSNTGQLKNLSHNTKVSKGRKFPQSSAKLLSQSELSQYNLDELQLMKSEMMAEHGFIFQDSTTQAYFEAQDWYFSQTQQIDSLLTDIERLNFNTLVKAEQEF